MPTQMDVGDLGTDRKASRATFLSCQILEHRQIDNTSATGIILDYLQDLAGTSLKCDTIPEDVTPVVII
jgi:hypothetical protein